MKDHPHAQRNQAQNGAHVQCTGDRERPDHAEPRGYGVQPILAVELDVLGVIDDVEAPAQSATASEISTGSSVRLPVTPIQAADGDMASAQPSSRLAAHVNRLVYGYRMRYAAATGARIRASVLSCHAAKKKDAQRDQRETGHLPGA